MSDMLSRVLPVDLEVRAGGDGRTVTGIVVPFDRVAVVSDGGPRYKEAFARGSFAKTIAERGDRVKLLSQHDARTNPLGRATSLREDAAGLYGEFRVSATQAGDEALELLRDGALDSFSVGFAPIKASDRSGVVYRTEVALREVSLVTFPAYEDARVVGVRALDLSPEDLAELARMVAEHTDLSVTRTEEPTDQGTSPEAALAEEPADAGHSSRRIHEHTLLIQRMLEIGVLK